MDRDPRIRTYRLLTVDEAAAEFPVPRDVIEEWFAAGRGGLFLKGKLWQLSRHDLDDGRPFISEYDLLNLIEARRQPRPHNAIVWANINAHFETRVKPSKRLPTSLA